MTMAEAVASTKQEGTEDMARLQALNQEGMRSNLGALFEHETA